MAGARWARAWGWSLPAALLAAAMLQIALAWRSPVVSPDGITFVRVAQELAVDPLGAVRGNAQHPGYPALMLLAHQAISAVAVLDDSWLIAGRLVNGLGGLASLLLIWLISRQWLCRRVADVAVWLAVALPVLRQNAADALSDSVHLALYLSALWSAGCALQRRHAGWSLGCGAFSGLAFWVRPEGLAVAAVAAATVLLVRRRIGMPWPAALRHSCLVVLGAAVVVAPYAALTGSLTGKMAPKPGWQAVLETPAASASSDEQVGAPGAEAIDPARSPIERWSGPWTLAVGLRYFGERLAESLRYLLLLPLLAGIPVALRSGSRPASAAVVLAVAVHLCLLLILFAVSGYMDRRHLLPLTALLLPAVAAGAVVLWQAVPRRVTRGTRLTQCAMIAAVVLALLPRCLRPQYENYLHVPFAGREVLAAADVPLPVASNLVHVLYYAAPPGQPMQGYYLHAASSLPVPNGSGPALVALELRDDNYNPGWTAVLETHYEPYTTVYGDAARKQADIVIYRPRPPAAVIAGHARAAGD